MYTFNYSGKDMKDIAVTIRRYTRASDCKAVVSCRIEYGGQLLFKATNALGVGVPSHKVAVAYLLLLASSGCHRTDEVRYAAAHTVQGLLLHNRKKYSVEEYARLQQRALALYSAQP